MGSSKQNVGLPSGLNLPTNPKKRKLEEEDKQEEEDMGSTTRNLDPPNSLKPDVTPKKRKGKDHEEEEDWCTQLDDNTWLLYTLDDESWYTGGRFKQIDKDGEVKYFPLRGCQMRWIFQRESLPSGCYEDASSTTAQVTYPCYKTIKATKHGESSVDLELLGSGLPPFNLSHLAWSRMREALNELYDWIWPRV